ncbi:LicD family-domain-containing protein [Lipomyces kononenkoae]|uniref:LicD family-domain-containing protein n=1 Tax=Lipomyces kononenkoae TaxID=34357 RepID=A0ACC3T1I7_LIPKO
MLRKFFVLLVLVVFAFSTLLTFLLSFAPETDNTFVPMSITHEKFYVPPPRGSIRRPQSKYFFEAVAKYRKQWVGLHYDHRYFKFELNEKDRIRLMRFMVEAWFAFLDENNLESWIAHGTLLGWYWNGQPLPWDLDVDVQMFIRTVERMSKQFNATTYEYITGEGESRHYYIDVNPYFAYRFRGKGENVIDARFVDMQNGLYIDITALAEADPIRRPNVLSCKNNHRYLVDDILPLRQTLFIGHRAYVPYEFERVLQKEYSRRALTNEKYMDFIFNVKEQKWQRQANSPSAHRGKMMRVGNATTGAQELAATRPGNAGARALTASRSGQPSSASPSNQQSQSFAKVERSYG